MKYLFLVIGIICSFCTNAQEKQIPLQICSFPISVENLSRLALEWRTNPITKVINDWDSTDRYLMKDIETDSPFVFFCPYITAKEKNVGVYIYTRKFPEYDLLWSEEKKDTYRALAPPIRRYIQMYIPVLCFENKMIITHKLHEKRQSLKEFEALYGELFSEDKKLNIQKIFLKMAFDPLMPDFPYKTNGRLPRQEEIDSPMHPLLKKTGELHKLQRMWTEHKKHEYSYAYYKYSYNKYLRCPECKRIKCDSCFDYIIRKAVVNDSAKIGVYLYMQIVKIDSYASYLIPILVFPNKLIATNNLTRKKRFLKQFLREYKHLFSLEEVQYLMDIYLEKEQTYSVRDYLHYD